MSLVGYYGGIATWNRSPETAHLSSRVHFKILSHIDFFVLLNHNDCTHDDQSQSRTK